MKREYFESVELEPDFTRLPLDEVIKHLAFNDQGLIPVITQDANSKQVLMMAWMNKSSLQATLNSGRMTYWSRSRNALWKKGESSGHWQELVSMQIDCDGDTLLCHVHQTGAACHTGRPHCFYLHVDAQQNQVEIISE